MKQGLVFTFGAILTVILTVYVYAVIMPDSKNGRLGKFSQWLHNFFRIKKFYIEAVMRFLYVLSTIGCFCVGFFMLFGKSYSLFGGYHSTTLQGILTMVFGPIICRIVYEALMMSILLVSNVISIKNRLYGLPDSNMLVNTDRLNENFADKVRKAAADALNTIERQKGQEDKEIQDTDQDHQ